MLCNKGNKGREFMWNHVLSGTIINSESSLFFVCWHRTCEDSCRCGFPNIFFTSHSAATSNTAASKQAAPEQVSFQNLSHLTTDSQSQQPVSFQNCAVFQCKHKLGNSCFLIGKRKPNNLLDFFWNCLLNVKYLQKLGAWGYFHSNQSICLLLVFWIYE